MRLSRHSLRRLSTWLAVVLLSMQIATAAYACPALLATSQPPAAMAEMPSCAGDMPGAMDAEQPLLCQAHCQKGTQTVQPTPAADSPAMPVLLAVLDWSFVAQEPTTSATQTPPLPSGAPPPGSPPLYLSLLVLRN
jgi:hypothetical protein